MPEASRLVPRRPVLLGGLGLFAGAFVGASNRRAGASPGRPLRFGLIADVQYADADPKNSRHYRDSLAKLRRCVDHLNHEPVEFVIQLGDLIDRDWQSFDPVLAELGRLQVPVHHVLGNHDYAVPADRRSQVVGKLGLKRSYYTFEAGHDWRVVVLDGNAISTFATPPDSSERAEAENMMDRLKAAGAPNGQHYNGGLDQTQLAWLNRTLQNAGAAGQRVIICCHYPIAPPDVHNLLNDVAVRQILIEHPCVKVWFNGHNHDGNYAEAGGLHFVNLQGMVETADTTAWAIATVEGDQMSIEGRGREPSRLLAIR